MDSIMQTEKKCFICARRKYLEEHHIFGGTANRKKSEKHGLKVWLCYEDHRGNSGVHFNRVVDLALKAAGQKKFEETHTREEFRKEFGKSWL
ncbi:hypothetical protein [Anaerosporobacter faecicola]|uniref:hypothetical protein n=1 Tax=Anaerosporobacter faecicola TaxID=2718714 RepID=UPI001438CE54|nr:hypothetical protein [Anaerosporobacter faecicola]